MEIKEIDGFRGYFVSTSGEVFSTRTGKWRKRKIQTAYHGYKMVEIRDDNGKAYFKSVHRLVAQTFIPNPEGKPQVNHIDADKANNNVDNLEWCTEAENTAHAIENGLRDSRGTANNWCTTTEEQIHHACQLLQDTNLQRKEIAEITGVCGDTLYKLRKGTSWEHIARQYNLKRPKKISKKLSEQQVIRVCELLNEERPYKEIEEETGLQKTTISKIKLGKSYKAIADAYLHKTSTAIESTSKDESE